MEASFNIRAARKALAWLNTLPGGPIRMLGGEPKEYAIIDILRTLRAAKAVKFDNSEFNNLEKYGIKTRLCTSDGLYLKFGPVEACVAYVRDNAADNETVREFIRRCEAPAAVAKVVPQCSCRQSGEQCEQWIKTANIGFSLLEDGLRDAREWQDADEIARFKRLIAKHRAEVAERLLNWHISA